MSESELSIILLTLRVSVVSTLCTMPFAVVIGWYMARSRSRIKTVAESLITFPLVAPPVVTGYLLLLLLGKNGIAGLWLYQLFGLRLVFNFGALVIASVAVSLPLAVRSVRSSFELIDPAYEKVSMTLGASKISTFFRISLPMALPGIMSGTVLSFARSLGEFGATITLAGNIPGKTRTISLLIYSDMQIPGKESEIIRLVGFSVILSFAAIAGSEYLGRRGGRRKV